MKAQKVIMTITVETLDRASIIGILSDALRKIDDEYYNGALTLVDGDTVEWITETVDVVI